MTDVFPPRATPVWLSDMWSSQSQAWLMLKSTIRTTRLILTVLLTLGTCSLLQAQSGGNNGRSPGGILVHPNGVIDQSVISPELSSSRRKQLKIAAEKLLPESLNAPSSMRCLSLRQLEQSIASIRASENNTLPPEILFLGGLTRIDHILLTEDGSDLLIAGPAEGFAALPGGRMVGTTSGRPVLCLDDLLVALRDEDILDRAGCSIDPDPERLAKSQTWLRNNSSPATLAVANARLEQMIRLLGLWNITTFGVPEDSRMALAMIEADYLMKRIATGIDSTGIRGMKSSLALANPGDNMMRRWWFAADSQCLAHDESRRIWTLQGPRFTLRAQEELMDANGNLVDSDSAKGSSSEFAQLFNLHIDQLVEQVPAFADLQNTFDLLITAAILRDSISNGTLSWTPSLLDDADALPTARYIVPRESPSLLKTKSGRGGVVIGAFTGGVSFPARKIIRNAGPAVASEKARFHAPPSRAAFPPGQWWREPARPIQ